MGGGGKNSSRRALGPISKGQSAAYPVDTSNVLARMLEQYGRQKRPQTVSFRKLVDWIKVGERATHYVHPYPAKLLPQIAHFFLAANRFIPRDAIVLDPFGGTGTVALEAILSGRNALYADVNPLARFISLAKTTLLSREEVESFKKLLRARFMRLRTADEPSVVNIEYWYEAETRAALAMLRRAINEVNEESVRVFMLVTFSAITRKLSNADPRLSVPVRMKNGVDTARTKKEVWNAFEVQLESNLRRMDALQALLPRPLSSVRCVGNDARALVNDNDCSLDAQSIDAVISSPPYAGAQKYIRASSLHLGWLGLVQVGQLAELERRSIGREYFSKKNLVQCPITSIGAANKVIRAVWEIDRMRAHICATYINEMEEVIAEIVRVLKPGGLFVLVIGNNEVCGLPFASSRYLQVLCERYGLQTRLRLIDEIKSRGLMTKRNKSAGLISREWVILFQKPKDWRD